MVADQLSESRHKVQGRWLASVGVFLILLGSYAYFRHARDWNTASRLMLTYALVDRGTILLNGLENQTGDRAKYQDDYYTDKQPGYSFLATIPYAVAKSALGLPDHPLDTDPTTLRYWVSDYWATLGTSGLSTALCGAILTSFAASIGCRLRVAVMIGLAYGLATPAYVYATLSYGHQLASTSVLLALLLIDVPSHAQPLRSLFVGGFLAAFASVVELSVGPVSAIVGLRVLVDWVRRIRSTREVIAFAVGVSIPTIGLMIYNQVAFDSVFEVGYFHHDNQLFKLTHSDENPLGLRAPSLDRMRQLLWGRYRGLFFYAPILLWAAIGWGRLWVWKRRGLAVTTILSCLAVFLVNASYPEWTGGWSTGPRLLVPLLPFAMVPVAASLVNAPRIVVIGAIVGVLWGAILIFLFQGVGARLPQFINDPLVEVVWPSWRGAPLPPFKEGERFTKTVAGVLGSKVTGNEDWNNSWLQFVPLVLGQLLSVSLLLALLGRSKRPRDSTTTRVTDREG